MYPSGSGNGKVCRLSVMHQKFHKALEGLILSRKKKETLIQNNYVTSKFYVANNEILKNT